MILFVVTLFAAISLWAAWHIRRKNQEAVSKQVAWEKKMQQVAETHQKNEARAKEFIKQFKDQSIEFAKKPMRSTWTGHTDPDSVWHDQRIRANQTLIEHGLPTLDGRGSFPDSPSLPQRPRVGNGQK